MTHQNNVPNRFYHIDYEDWIMLPEAFDTKRFLVRINTQNKSNIDKFFNNYRYYSLLAGLESEDLTYLTLCNIKFEAEMREKIIEKLRDGYKSTSIHARSDLVADKHILLVYKGAVIDIDARILAYSYSNTFYLTEKLV